MNSLKKKIQNLYETNLQYNKNIQDILDDNNSLIIENSEMINNLNITIENELKKSTALYENSLTIIQSKEDQINDILGHASGRAIAGDYETSAQEERSVANLLRYASLACMLLIIGIVGYSFWETTTSEFQWQNATFRIILAIMLSIPAAYLARESTKHREQQYNHLQTSLDLKAITPYIASLPEDVQHNIKFEVARNLFSSREHAKANLDSYPINTHEIVLEILKKLESSNAESK